MKSRLKLFVFLCQDPEFTLNAKDDTSSQHYAGTPVQYLKSRISHLCARFNSAFGGFSLKTPYSSSKQNPAWTTGPESDLVFLVHRPGSEVT